jgi:hypothetical protein
MPWNSSFDKQSLWYSTHISIEISVFLSPHIFFLSLDVFFLSLIFFFLSLDPYFLDLFKCFVSSCFLDLVFFFLDFLPQDRGIGYLCVSERLDI